MKLVKITQKEVIENREKYFQIQKSLENPKMLKLKKLFLNMFLQIQPDLFTLAMAVGLQWVLFWQIY